MILSYAALLSGSLLAIAYLVVPKAQGEGGQAAQLPVMGSSMGTAQPLRRSPRLAVAADSASSATAVEELPAEVCGMPGALYRQLITSAV